MIDWPTDVVDAVFGAFGGSSKLARAIKRPVSTVDTWKQRKRIPYWNANEILVAAERNGIALPLKAHHIDSGAP